MPIFKFKRTVQYTEEVEVEAPSAALARAAAAEQEGVRNNDDTIVDIEPID